MDVRLPNGLLIKGVPDNITQEELVDSLRGAGYNLSELGIEAPVPETPEPERTVLGQVGETFKGVGRGFAGAFLSAGEGLAELADAATNVVGLKDAIDTGEENELVKASRAGRDWINNSALGVDPNYSDAWFTKFGEGVGSMASFLTPAAGLRALGAAGKATRLGMGTRELGAAATLATGAGAGDQAQRIAAARAQGLDVSQGQEDAAIALGGIIGLSEIAPIANILKRVPSNITPVDKSRILDLLQRSIRGGAEEAVQEASAGLLQDLTERGIYNEKMPIGQSFWDDLTVGGAVGAFTDFVVNAAAGRRSFMTTEAQREYEAKAREREQANIEKIRASLAAEAERRANRQADPAAFGRAAEAAQAGAVNIPAPTVDGAPVTAGQAYARLISRELGDYFPANTKFEVKEVDPTVTETGERIPNYVVVDSTGRQYGQPVQNYEQAVGLSYGLNNEVIDGQIRGQILNTLETSGQSYDQVTADTLTRYGYQILNPEANMITSAALNEAAGTTADKGYIENYSFQTILDGEEVKEDGKRVGYRIQGPDQKEMVVPGLTLAQQINQQRKAKGLAETQTFTIEEARDALGDKFERLTDINVQAIPDGMTYTATIVPTEVEVSKGKRTTVNIPSVVSSAGEVFQTRFASQEDSDASGKNEDGTPRVKVGQKIELQSLEDAQAFADRKNREAAKGQGLSIQEINALMKGEKTLTNEISRLLKAKNVGSEIDTPEIKALFKSIVGKESLADMNFGEQRLLYARLRNLPTFEATTKLPLFEAKPYTRDNFLRASKFVQDANSLGQSVTDQQIAEAAGFLPGDERLQIKVDAIKQDLQKQGVPTARPAKPILLLPAPTDTTDTYNFLREEIRKKMKGFGLDDIATRIDQTLLNYGDPVRYMQEAGSETEGYYNPFLREITLAVDRVDPDKTLTPEQRVNALVDVLNHEIVHPARELDLWTGQEWDTLSRASAKLRRRDSNTGQETNETYLQWANRTYADQSPLIREEEAVADLSRQAKKFGPKAVAGKPKVLAERLFTFFDKLDNSFRGAGFQNYTDILNRLQSGEIGARTRGEIRTLRATEAELAKEGILPERFADYQPIIANPVARNQEREKKKVEIQQQVQQKAPAGTDFNPMALEGAAIRESRRSIESIPANIEVDNALKPTTDSEGRVIYSGYEGPEMFGMQTRPTQEGLTNFWRWFGKSKTVDSNKRPLVFYHGTAADITQFRPKQAGAVFMTRNPKFAEGFAGYSDNYLVSNFPDFMSDQQVVEVLNETLSKSSAFSPNTYDKVAAARDEAVQDVQQNKPIRGSALTVLKDVASKGVSSRYLDAIQKRLPSSANLMPVYVKADNPFDYENTDHVKQVLEEADRISPEPLSGFEAEGIFNGDWGVIETPKILAAIKNLGFDSMYVEEQGEKNLAVFDPSQIKSAIGNNGDFGPTPSIRESRSSAPIINALRVARTGFKDYSSSSQEQFFGNFWPRVIGSTRGQVSPSPENVRVAVERSINDLRPWLARNPRYLDYYNKDFAATRRILETKYGPLTEDQFTMFRLLSGLTSPSTELPDNISDALKSFDVWNQDGNFDSFVMGKSPKGNTVLMSAPFTLIGPTLSNKARTFKVIERLIKEKGGVVNAANFLKEQIPVGALHNFNREMGYSGPVGDIGAIKGLVKMATGQDKLIPRMFIFGPKVGAYTLNMTGESGYNTVDIWESRLIRSYFTGLFSERYGLPGNVSEHELFQDFIKTFKEVFEQQTGKQWDTSALQAMRWFFIIDSARKAGYTEARTNETISEYVRRNIELPRASRPYRRGQGDGDVGGEIPSIRESRLGSERAGDRRGRDQGGAITPLAGSPTVQGGGPIPEIVGVAEQYAKDNNIPYNRQRTYVDVDEDRAKRIADAFEAMAHDPKNPAVVEAYRDLIKQTRDQYDALVNAGYRFTFFDADTDPYGSNPWNAIRDLRQNKRMAVYGTYAGYGTQGITDSELENNPLLEDTGLRWPDQNGVEQIVTANDLFRAVHDAFGHGIEGAGFRARGEENAWQAHARLFKGPALAALTTETRGQNSWLNYGPYGERNRNASTADTVFAEQKIGLMPEWTWQEGFESGYAPVEIDQQVKEPLALPKEQLDRAVKKAEENVAKAPFGTVPLYNLNASPEALYVAQNPEAGEKLDANDFIRYSRNNQPTYSPGVDQILDKLAVDPPNQTVGQTIVQGLTLSPFRRLVEIFRMNWINNNSRLEYLYQRDPNLMRNTADASALVGVELADRHRAITASAIRDGVPVYRNGLVKVEDFIHNNRRYRGLAEVMAPLYSNQYGNLERLAQSYAIALRGRRLTAEGKLAPGDPADLPRLEAEVARFVNPETGNPIIKEWYDAWQAYNGYVVQFLRDTGMIDDAGAQLWLQQSDYIPFYRETKGGSVAHPKIFGGLTSTTHLKAVGKSSEAVNMPLLESILTNLDAAIAMGMKNVAQQRIVRDMIQIGLGRMVQPGEQTEGLSTVTFKVQGKKYSAFIDDPLIFESMQALPELGVTGVLETVFRVPANLLREMITREPGYMIANLMRDTASVTFTSQASIAAAGTAVKNFADGFDQLRRTGVIGGYDFARDPQDMAVYLSDEAKKMGHEIPVEYPSALGKVSRSKYLKPFSWIWDAAGQVSDRSEAFNRIRVYEDTLKRTGNEAEAVYQALSVLNYGRRGRSPIIRTLSAVVPFLNARIQGLDKLYQAGTGQFGPTRSRTKNALNFTARAALMVGLTMYYYSMVSDDDEYKNANPEVLDNYYIFPTGMGFAVRIPIPFEVGLLFKTLPERIMRLSDGTDTFRDARQSAARAVTSTLAFNPIPQAVLPIAEIYANYDTFTGRSVIPPYMDERIAAEYQTRFGTNELARRLGEATGYSPIKIDHLLNGYFGTLGTYTLDAIDHLLRDSDRAYPARDPYEYPFVRRFFADANQPGLQAQYYDLYREVGKVTNTMRELREDGRVEELNAYILENQNILAVKSGVDALNKIMKNYRNQKDAVLKSPLDPEVKKQVIDQMDANMNATLQIMPILRRTAFSEQRQAG